MKILYVIPYFVPAWSFGGPVRVVYDFAKELTKLGNDVSVATTDVLDYKSRNPKLFEKIDGITVFRFKNISSMLVRKLNFYAPIGLSGWLKHNVKDYDVIHVHEFFAYQSYVACKIARRLNRPYMIQPHGSLSRFCQTSRFNLIKKIVVRMFAPLVKSCSAIIALNEAEKEDIAKVYPKTKSKIKIAPNGLDLDEFTNISPIDLHRAYSIVAKNKIIAFIGRIHPKKGLDITLKALAQLKEKLNFTFLIIGPDEGAQSNLEDLAEKLGVKDRIVFTGLISGRKKLETLKGTYCSLLNSRSEGLPTTLLESAALGLPIICSRTSNLPEVEQYQAGYVVDTIQQTAQKISEIMGNDHLREELSQNALKLARSFGLTKCARALNKIYEQAI